MCGHFFPPLKQLGEPQPGLACCCPSEVARLTCCTLAVPEKQSLGALGSAGAISSGRLVWSHEGLGVAGICSCCSIGWESSEVVLYQEAWSGG